LAGVSKKRERFDGDGITTRTILASCSEPDVTVVGEENNREWSDLWRSRWMFLFVLPVVWILVSPRATKTDTRIHCKDWGWKNESIDNLSFFFKRGVILSCLDRGMYRLSRHAPLKVTSRYHVLLRKRANHNQIAASGSGFGRQPRVTTGSWFCLGRSLLQWQLVLSTDHGDRIEGPCSSE
jgi:hypothetical protein